MFEVADAGNHATQINIQGSKLEPKGLTELLQTNFDSLSSATIQKLKITKAVPRSG